MSGLLPTLYGYHAWANNELLGKLAVLDPGSQKSELNTAIRLVNHSRVVAEIFAAHLTDREHRRTSDNTVETPALGELHASVATIDQWYLDYVQNIASAELSEAISFSFTDGDHGRMTREEMLMHVALHATFHRGEACRILSQLSIRPPWDTPAVYLHQAEPSRRTQDMRRRARD